MHQMPPLHGVLEQEPVFRLQENHCRKNRTAASALPCDKVFVCGACEKVYCLNCFGIKIFAPDEHATFCAECIHDVCAFCGSKSNVLVPVDETDWQNGNICLVCKNKKEADKDGPYARKRKTAAQRHVS
jgi:alpha-D-ribose 1-methylphosphonate 5-phosphate C-P lyase